MSSKVFPLYECSIKLPICENEKENSYMEVATTQSGQAENAWVQLAQMGKDT